MTMIAQNSTSLIGMAQSTNTELFMGFLGLSFMLVVFFVSFLNFMHSTNDFRRSLGPSMIILFVVTLLLRAIDLVPDLALTFTLFALAISLAVTSTKT